MPDKKTKLTINDRIKAKVKAQSERTAVTYNESDYMYAATKVSAMSCALIRRDRLETLADAGDGTDVLARLAEYGIATVLTDGVPDAEATLTAYLCSRYDELASFCPDTPLIALARYRYDCHNVKTAIKCRFLGQDPTPFFINCGSVPSSDVAEAATKHDYSCLPDAMASAATASDAELEGSRSTRVVDAMLDVACFKDMRRAAVAIGFSPVIELLTLKSDLTDILTVLRVMRIKNRDNAAAILSDSLVGGGKIDAEAYAAASSPAALASLAAAEGYQPVADAMAHSGADTVPTSKMLEEVSLACDNYFAARIGDMTRMRMLGAYPLLAYVIALEYEIKNLRIIISGTGAGTDSQTVRERLRNCNV